MIVPIDRGKRIILLNWLKRGYIDTMEMPDAYKGGSLFLELMKKLDNKEGEEEE